MSLEVPGTLTQDRVAIDMEKSSPLRRATLLTLAVLYAVVVTTYCALWLYSIHLQITVELGFDNLYISSENCELVRSVVRHSPADNAGIKPGDRIVALNGRRIGDSFSITDVWSRSVPGDSGVPPSPWRERGPVLPECSGGCTNSLPEFSILQRHRPESDFSADWAFTDGTRNLNSHTACFRLSLFFAPSS